MKIQKTIRLRVGSRLLALKVLAWNSKATDHTGITNRIAGKYIPFWDFANNPPTTLDMVKESLEDVLDEWDLSTAYILQTVPKESYRAFGLDLLTFQQAIGVLASTQHIDLNYLKSLVIRGRSVIRISQKPNTHNEIVASVNRKGGFPLSMTHYMFLAKLYGIPHIPYSSNFEVELSRYETLG